MQGTARVITQLYDVQAELAALDLTPELLAKSLAYGMGFRRDCTIFDPQTAPGFFVWAKTIAELRRRLATADWTAAVENGVEVTVRPSSGFQVVVTAGNSKTGLDQGAPQVNRRKGNGTTKVLEDGQAMLLGLEREHQQGDGPATWLFMYFYDVDKDEWRAELSLPMSIRNGLVNGWVTRILLPLDADGNVAAGNIGPTTPSDEDDIVIEVQRRSSAG